MEAVEALIEDCGIMTTLEELEIPEKDFPELAKVAMTVARPLANNPCRMTRRGHDRYLPGGVFVNCNVAGPPERDRLTKEDLAYGRCGTDR